jgi:hypothetical protein
LCWKNGSDSLCNRCCSSRRHVGGSGGYVSRSRRARRGELLCGLGYSLSSFGSSPQQSLLLGRCEIRHGVRRSTLRRWRSQERLHSGHRLGPAHILLGLIDGISSFRRIGHHCEISPRAADGNGLVYVDGLGLPIGRGDRDLALIEAEAALLIGGPDKSSRATDSADPDRRHNFVVGIFFELGDIE